MRDGVGFRPSRGRRHQRKRSVTCGPTDDRRAGVKLPLRLAAYALAAHQELSSGTVRRGLGCMGDIEAGRRGRTLSVTAVRDLCAPRVVDVLADQPESGGHRRMDTLGPDASWLTASGGGALGPRLLRARLGRGEPHRPDPGQASRRAGEQASRRLGARAAASSPPSAERRASYERRARRQRHGRPGGHEERGGGYPPTAGEGCRRRGATMAPSRPDFPACRLHLVRPNVVKAVSTST